MNFGFSFFFNSLSNRILSISESFFTVINAFAQFSSKETISEAISQIYIKANAKDIEICVDMEKDVETQHDRI